MKPQKSLLRRGPVATPSALRAVPSNCVDLSCYFSEPTVDAKAKLVIKVDRDLEDIAPGYLENRRKDAEMISVALERSDFEALKMIGHRMKGSGAGYGFQRITDIGTQLEQAATLQNRQTARDSLDQLVDYLDAIEVVYV
ncbi:MAG: Hpt domain-containing protein [Magnetococcales bacterium]|nr:Hpt domain-containing protein [Magnetococcales bacterium]